jgi:DNA polymerase III gamma/tau subunit
MQDQLIEQLTQEAQAAQDTPQVPQEPQDAPQDAPEAQEAAPVEEAPAEPQPDVEAELKALKAERKRARDLEKQLQALQAQLDTVAKEDLTEQEKAITEAVAAARAEAKAQYDEQMLRLRVESKAAGMSFHDPKLALGLLELEADATDDEILDALKGLAEERPYLVKTAVPKMDMGPRAGANGSIGATSNENWFRNLLTGQDR